MSKDLNVHPLLNKSELEQVTEILLEACSRNGHNFSVFEPVLFIIYDND